MIGGELTRQAGLVPRLRTRECDACGKDFQQVRLMQAVCGPVCALRLVRARAKAERADTGRRKEAAKTRPRLVAEAQQAFNAFIRARDAERPCICCGRPLETNRPGGGVDAGHYLSRGAAPHLRFDERNVHAQNKHCNRPGGTTRAAFRAGMLQRIGAQSLAELEADQSVRKWSADDLRAIRDEYRRKLKEMRK